MNATALARLLLALAYPWLAHAASLRHDPSLAAIALGDIAVIVLLDPLVHRRAWAWALLPRVLAACANHGYANASNRRGSARLKERYSTGAAQRRVFTRRGRSSRVDAMPRHD